MKSRGLITISLILLLAVSATGFAWWFRHSQTKRCLEYWGAENARRIGAANEIEYFQLVAQPDTESSQGLSNSQVVLEQTQYTQVRVVDAAKLRGVSHFRHALTQDSSYNWDSLEWPDEPITWDVLLRFESRGEETSVVFDFEKRVLKILPEGKPLCFDPVVFGITQFLEGEVQAYLER